MTRLPIDDEIPAIVRAMAGGSAVVEAPPGAGKTTRVPPALLEATAGEIWVTEPRRLAARLAAARVASELGEEPGQTCGYQVRFEKVAGARTRIRFVTEGVLLRRLAADPQLEGIGAVLFDELHERSLEADLGLALAVELQRTERPDLAVGAMSATLEAEPVARLLGGAPRIRSEGRRFEVAIEHAGDRDDRPLEVQVRAALRRLLRDGLDGHVLVFLPGAREIRRCAEALAELAEHRDLSVLPLHGQLPPAEQDRAVGAAVRRKVILSTNVAESSITIEGVAAVIDSGLARVAGHSPWTGLPTLEVKPVSRASADQRAGRAGRTGPGRCLRLFTRHDYESRPAHATPEVARADLAGALLLVRALGYAPERLPWLDPPPEPALDAAGALLTELGALEGERVTARGRRMLSFPVHPRLARLILAGEELGAGRDAVAAAALLGERDPRPRGALGAERRAAVAGDSDVTDWLDRWRRRRDIDRRALRAADQMVARLGRRIEDGGAGDEAERDERVRRALLAAFPDRLARRRREGSSELLLARGGAAVQGEGSVVRDAELLVVVAAEERSGKTIASAASAVEPEWLLDDLAHALEDTTQLELEAGERVVAVSRLRYGAVVLEESRRPPRGGELEEAAAILVDAARRAPRRLGEIANEQALRRWLGRLAFAREAFPDRGFPALGEEDLWAAVSELSVGRTSLSELRDADLLNHLRGRLGGDLASALDRIAPERIELRGGRRVRVVYEEETRPFIAVRLQELFGMTETPAVAEGRVPLTLHLLAPNQRAVQVTTDLAGFWENHYPQVKRRLERRYPRHAWPDDPTVLQPTMRRKKRRGGA